MFGDFFVKNRSSDINRINYYREEQDFDKESLGTQLRKIYKYAQKVSSYL